MSTDSPTPPGMIPIKDHLDSQVAEIRRATDIAVKGGTNEVDLLKHIERVLEEKARALEIAETEREKAARVLRETEQHAQDTAASEREKAAQQVRETLTQLIQSGDANLRDHIGGEVARIRMAMDAGEKLEIVRIETLRAEVMAGRDLLSQIQSSAAVAIDKAEIAVNNRLKIYNEIQVKAAADRAELPTREAIDAKFETTVSDRNQLRDRISAIEVTGAADVARRDQMTSSVASLVTRSEEYEKRLGSVESAGAGMRGYIAGGLAIATLLIVVVLAIANYAFGGG